MSIFSRKSKKEEKQTAKAGVVEVEKKKEEKAASSLVVSSDLAFHYQNRPFRAPRDFPASQDEQEQHTVFVKTKL